jgi:hypothetical protein
MFNTAKEGAITHGGVEHWRSFFLFKKSREQRNHSKVALKHHAKLPLAIKRSNMMVTLFRSNCKGERTHSHEGAINTIARKRYQHNHMKVISAQSHKGDINTIARR